VELALVSALGLFAACADDAPPPSGCTDVPRAPEGVVLDTARTADLDPTSFDGGAVVAMDPESLPIDDAAFPLGVQAGMASPSSILLWTRIGDAAVKTLRVWRDAEAPGDVVLVQEEAIDAAATDGFVHAIVSELAPATTYRYAFFGGGARSAIGTFRTAFADDMELRLRFGATACTGSVSPVVRAMQSPFPALSRMASQDLDLFVHLGDMSYNDGAATEDEFRAAWASTLSEPGFRDLMSATSYYAVWDDHEISDNWDAETFDPDVVRAGFDAFFETLAVERGPNDRIWRSHRWGRTAEFFALDLRSERRSSTIGSGSEELVSAEQLEWLKSGLADSPAHFKIVLTSVNITGMNGWWDSALSFRDRWEGFAAQREELLSFIDDHAISNVWFLAGDIHMGFIGRLEPMGRRYANLWEITIGPGGSASNPRAMLYEAGERSVDPDFQCDLIAWAHGRQSATTVIELDPIADAIRVTFEEGFTGELLFDGVLRQ
jgi:alkaline phosphatase D